MLNLTFRFVMVWLAIAALAAVSGGGARGRTGQDRVTPAPAKLEPVKPFVWQTDTPESQGMSSAKLAG